MSEFEQTDFRVMANAAQTPRGERVEFTLVEIDVTSRAGNRRAGSKLLFR